MVATQSVVFFKKSKKTKKKTERMNNDQCAICLCMCCKIFCKKQWKIFGDINIINACIHNKTHTHTHTNKIHIGYTQVLRKPLSKFISFGGHKKESHDSVLVFKINDKTHYVHVIALGTGNFERYIRPGSYKSDARTGTWVNLLKKLLLYICLLCKFALFCLMFVGLFSNYFVLCVFGTKVSILFWNKC